MYYNIYNSGRTVWEKNRAGGHTQMLYQACSYVRKAAIPPGPYWS